MKLHDSLVKLIQDDPEVRKKFIALTIEPDRTVIKRKKVADSLVVAVSFQLPFLPDDFRELIPGSNLWIRFWKKYPDRQDDMLIWKKDKEVKL